MTDTAASTSPPEVRDRRRVPRWALVGVAVALVPIIVIGGVWTWHKKPWLMDDFRAGFAVGSDIEAREMGKRDDPCGDAVAARYGGEGSFALAGSDELTAFMFGCVRGLNGLSNDWWNVSGYLTA